LDAEFFVAPERADQCLEAALFQEGAQHAHALVEDAPHGETVALGEDGAGLAHALYLVCGFHRSVMAERHRPPGHWRVFAERDTASNIVKGMQRRAPGQSTPHRAERGRAS
jgi:hypothetical protein